MLNLLVSVTTFCVILKIFNFVIEFVYKLLPPSLINEFACSQGYLEMIIDHRLLSGYLELRARGHNEI